VHGRRTRADEARPSSRHGAGVESYGNFGGAQPAYDPTGAKPIQPRQGRLKPSGPATLAHPTAASTQLKRPSSRGCCAVSCPRAGKRRCRPSPSDKGLAHRQLLLQLRMRSPPALPELIRRLRDLHPLQPDRIKGEASFQKGGEANAICTRCARRHAMAAILNDRVPRQWLDPLWAAPSWFFAGYMVGAHLRLSALLELGVIYVLTTIRSASAKTPPPTSGFETARLRCGSNPQPAGDPPGGRQWNSGLAYEVAISNPQRPTVLALSRQAMANQAEQLKRPSVAKRRLFFYGFFFPSGEGTPMAPPELILIGSGHRTGSLRSRRPSS